MSPRLLRIRSQGFLSQCIAQFTGRQGFVVIVEGILIGQGFRELHIFLEKFIVSVGLVIPFVLLIQQVIASFTFTWIFAFYVRLVAIVGGIPLRISFFERRNRHSSMLPAQTWI